MTFIRWSAGLAVLMLLAVASGTIVGRPKEADAERAPCAAEGSKDDQPTGFQFEITVPKTTVHPLEPIVVTVTLENTGNVPVPDSEGSWWTPGYDFTVCRDKRPMPRTQHGRQLYGYVPGTDLQLEWGSYGFSELKPGERCSAKFMLNREWDMTLEGDYTVQASRLVSRYAKNGRTPEPAGTLHSNILKITIKGSVISLEVP